MPGGRAEGALGAKWREAALRTQCEALPGGRVLASCTAALGAGGLGRHLQEIVDALERAGSEAVCICGSTRASAVAPAKSPPTPPAGDAVPDRRAPRAAAARSVGVRTRAFMVEFDAYAAEQLPAARAPDRVQQPGADAVSRGAARGLRVACRWSRPTRTCAESRASTRWPIASTRSRGRGRRACSSATSASTRRRIASTSPRRYTRESFLEEGFREERSWTSR